MKHKTLFYFVAVLLTFFIAFNACQEEDIIASKELQPVAKSAKIYSLFLTKNEVLSDFNNPKIAGIINSKFSNSIEARQMTNADSLLFEKIVKDDNFVTYNLLLNQYTEQTPYLEYFTITKDSLNKVRAGYIKYTPTTSEIDFSKYNGIIEVFGLDDVLIGKAAFANGLLQPEPQNSSSRWACLGSYTIIVQHNCTNGGNHAPGTVCNDGINDGYYELVTHLTGCHFLADPHQIIGDLEGSINSLGSGDYNTQNLNLLMTHLNAQEKALINSNIYFRKHILGLVSGITELDDDYILYMKGILDYYLLNYEVYQSLQSYTANPVENENKTIVIDNLLARLTENQTEGQKNFTKEAFDYLTENPEEDEFITWAIDYLMLHPEFDTAQENWLEEIEFEYWSQHINRLDIDSNPCAKIVYDSLFQNSNKTAFKLVKSYMGKRPICNLDWDVLPLSGANAQTSVESNGELINITINSTYLSEASKISVARTLTHELLHAEMMKKLISVGYNVSPNNFPGLWDYWVRYKNGNSDGNDFQHNLMSQHMRSEIILVLKEFDLMFGTTREEWQYEALSWGGLYGTRPWNNFMQTNSALATQYYQYIQEQQEAGGCP